MSGFTNRFKKIAKDDEPAYCKNDHKITPDNVYVSRGKRRCRQCQLMYSTRYRRRVTCA